jgi:Tfp pilus assembly protein PilO
MLRNRGILLIILVGVAALTMIYALFLHPKQSHKRQEIQEEERRVKALLEATQIQLTKTEEAIQAVLEQGVPLCPRAERGWEEWQNLLIKDVDNLVRDTQVTLLKFEPGAPEEQLFSVKHPFQLQFRGTFSSISRFLQGLEQGLRLVPEQWSIETDSKEGEERALKATCSAIAYEWTGEVLHPPAGETEEFQPLQMASLRDPFVREEETSGAISSPLPTHRLTLTGILNFRGEPTAIINGRPYKVGDRLEGKPILSIEDDKVIIEGEPRPLKIERPLQVVPPS